MFLIAIYLIYVLLQMKSASRPNKRLKKLSFRKLHLTLPEFELMDKIFKDSHIRVLDIDEWSCLNKAVSRKTAQCHETLRFPLTLRKFPLKRNNVLKIEISYRKSPCEWFEIKNLNLIENNKLLNEKIPNMGLLTEAKK